MAVADYDPFASGRFPVSVRTIEASDLVRGRVFPCEIWYPAQPGKAHPLIVYSHSSGGHRRSATFLATHLASHGYVVAAMDHSERVASELARREGEMDTERAARIDAVIASRVPDIRFLLDHLLGETDTGIVLDASRIGLVGHSFGGWTVLATAEVEPRVKGVVAMVPGGSSRPRPGILPLTLTFSWDRDVPTLYLAAEQDTMIPLASVYELFDRTPGSKRLFILRRADHQHFIDDVEGEHEALRSMSLPGDAAWIPAAMRPMAELASGEQAHIFVRGLTLAHLDATLRGLDAARGFLDADVEAELAKRGVEAIAHRP
ncbi:MAG TPA: dienelactone hydrolase family protein [Candidatus Dormibacteraeota bacterium]|nr:dienelactone hydrolase family protein [Candidatus Dormibacteraeota bacterium]